jgi:N-acetylglutamate synthase-like GNAT family acetyltransferase
MRIRAARIEDAPQACVVVRRSITELCLADHQDDPTTLQKWLANKTPANLSSWIAKPDNHMFVATDGDAILGVACVTSCGEVTLNYVSPDVRFRGVSKALLQRLEAKAAELGNERCVLTSTGTARLFYLLAGYEEQGLPTGGFFTDSSCRMAKRLCGTQPVT